MKFPPTYHEDEEFRLIPGFEMYCVSNYGRVFSRWCGSRLTSGWFNLKGSAVKSGHVKVGLVSQDGIKEIFVHRLVIETFLGPPIGGMECCHYDGDPRNNKLSNLRWGTRKDNEADKKRHGVDNSGVRNGMAKLTTDQEDEIRLKSIYKSRRELAAEYGVAHATINRVVNRV